MKINSSYKLYYLLALSITLILCTGISSAADIYVGNGPEYDFANISTAVSFANNSDTIIVSDGIYIENIDINKEVTIISENGSAKTTVQALTPHDHIFNITANNVTVYGFNVTGATNYTGILMLGASNFNVSDNVISESYAGIYVEDSSNGLLADNIANSNYQGIILEDSTNCTLVNNRMTLNDFNFEVYGSGSAMYVHDINISNLINDKPVYYWINRSDEQVPSDAGIVYVINSTNITVKDVITSNNWEDITLVETDNCTIQNIRSSDSETGIAVLRSDFTTIDSSEVSGNFVGVVVETSNNTIVSNNNASCNYYGIVTFSSNHSSLISNTVNSNSLGGIYTLLSNSGCINNNTANSNMVGIRLTSSNNNNLTGNTASSNSIGGIGLSASNNNTLISNTANNNIYDPEGLQPLSINSEILSTDQPDHPVRGSSFDNSVSHPANIINSISINGISPSANGIQITDSENNTLSDTNAIGNDYGFISDSSVNTTVNDLVLTNSQAKLSFITDEYILRLKGDDSNSLSLSGKVNVNGYIHVYRFVAANEDNIPIRISYDDSGMSRAGESSISLYSLNGSQWSKVPNSTLSTNNNYVSATITEAEENPSIDMPGLSYEATLALFKNPESSASSGSSGSSVMAKERREGTITDLPVGSDGEVTGDTIVKSSNAATTLTLYKGTKAVDASGNPVNRIIVTTPSSLPADTPREVIESGLYFRFGPSGTTFSHDVMVTMDFDPADFEGRTPVIYTYTSEGGWMALETTIDWENGRATAMISHFSLYALFGTETEITEDISFEPASESTVSAIVEEEDPVEGSDEKSGSGYLFWVVGIVILVGLAIVFVNKQK